MKFERTDDYNMKLFDLALDQRNITLDSPIQITYDSGKRKNRAWAVDKKCWVQFPNSLRTKTIKYQADLVAVESESRDTFYRVMKGSIRLFGSDEVKG